jgi:hypothetical protein
LGGFHASGSNFSFATKPDGKALGSLFRQLSQFCGVHPTFLENTTIRALPTQPGDYVQANLFFGGYFGNTLNRIPSRIFFDMHLGGPASRIGQIDPPACFFASSGSTFTR